MTILLATKRHKRGAFYAQRGHSKRRGIPFEFSFLEWCLWWREHLGPDWFNKRGRLRGQYVMARKRDKGPYTWDNCECILHEQNCSDRVKHGTHKGRGGAGSKNANSKLTENQVIRIFLSHKSFSRLAKENKVSKSAICFIKTKRTWAHVTDKLQ